MDTNHYGINQRIHTVDEIHILNFVILLEKILRRKKLNDYNKNTVPDVFLWRRN